MHLVYADHAATTPLRPEVREAMGPHLGDLFGNPSSSHRWGRRALAALEEARSTLATALGAAPSEVVFTRGGTEANNMALVGSTALASPGAPIIVSAIEHKAVLDTAEHLKAPVVSIPVRAGSGLDLDAFESALSRAAVASLMWVNNETGDALPIAEAATLARAAGVPFHSDAVQAVGKLPIALDEVPVDLMTLTGHKIGGPTSAGALFVRTGTDLEPLLQGGGQERGLRPGTQDVAGAVGLAAAVQIAVREREDKFELWSNLGDRLIAGLRQIAPGVVRNGVGLERAPHVVNVGFPGQTTDALLAALDMEGIAASGGSACSSGSGARSYVLEAIERADGGREAVPAPPPVRFSFGWSSTAEDVDRILQVVELILTRTPAGTSASA